MRLSTRSRYGTRLVLDIAKHGSVGPVSLSKISDRQRISLKYLEQLTIILKKAGIITSIRGASGGYMLNRSPSNIFIGDIIRVLEGTDSITDCTDCIDKKISVCDMKKNECLTRSIWLEASKKMFEYLDTITLEDVLSKKLK